MGRGLGGAPFAAIEELPLGVLFVVLAGVAEPEALLFSMPRLGGALVLPDADIGIF